MNNNYCSNEKKVFIIIVFLIVWLIGIVWIPMILLSVIDSPLALNYFSKLVEKNMLFALLTSFGVPLLLVAVPYVIALKTSFWIGDLINKYLGGIKGWKKC